MLLSPSFCSEKTRPANCCGPEIGWQHEAIKDNRPVLKCTNEWSGPLACPSELFVILFPHIQRVHSWLSALFGDLCEHACSNRCTGCQTRNSRLCAFPHTSIRRPLINLGPAIWYGSSGGPPCLGCTPCGRQFSLICSEQSLGWTVPLGMRTLFRQKKVYPRDKLPVFSSL